MAKLTKKKAIKLHRRLWDWLYHHPSKRKEDWPEWKFNGGRIADVKSWSFGCHLKFHHDILLFEACENCCFDNFICLGGLFINWKQATTAKVRKKYAKLIRDLPERK